HERRKKSSQMPRPCSLPEPVHGFLLRKDKRREGEFTSIDFPGAISTATAGINARGDIVGTYIDQGGRTHGFLLSRGEQDESADEGDPHAELNRALLTKILSGRRRARPASYCLSNELSG